MAAERTSAGGCERGTRARSPTDPTRLARRPLRIILLPNQTLQTCHSPCSDSTTAGLSGSALSPAALHPPCHPSESQACSAKSFTSTSAPSRWSPPSRSQVHSPLADPSFAIPSSLTKILTDPPCDDSTRAHLGMPSSRTNSATPPSAADSGAETSPRSNTCSGGEARWSTSTASRPSRPFLSPRAQRRTRSGGLRAGERSARHERCEGGRETTAVEGGPQHRIGSKTAAATHQ